MDPDDRERMDLRNVGLWRNLDINDNPTRFQYICSPWKLKSDTWKSSLKVTKMLSREAHIWKNSANLYSNGIQNIFLTRPLLQTRRTVNAVHTSWITQIMVFEDVTGVDGYYRFWETRYLHVQNKRRQYWNYHHKKGYRVPQLADSLRYKPEGRLFNPDRVRQQCGPAFDAACRRSKYQGYMLGDRGGQCVRSTTLLFYLCGK
jgi:hypothetical protein